LRRSHADSSRVALFFPLQLRVHKTLRVTCDGSGSYQVAIPYFDPNIRHAGICRLRALNVTHLRELDKKLVIQDNDKPLAVLLKYEHFLAMQEKIQDGE
jgi:hypothetical protein